MGDVERCHNVTARTRTKASNKKLDSTTEAYCEIAESESKKEIKRKYRMRYNFRSRLCKLTKLREERASAEKATAEAWRVGDGDADLADDENV
jgi:hypothetical protein